MKNTVLTTVFGRLVGFEILSSKGGKAKGARLRHWTLYTWDGQSQPPTHFELALWKNLPNDMRQPAFDPEDTE